MTTTARRYGAIGLATATLVAALAHAPTARAEAPRPTAASSGLIGPFVTQNESTDWKAVGTPTRGATVPVVKEATLAAAEQVAQTWSVPTKDAPGEIRWVGGDADLCLTYRTHNDFRQRYTAEICDGSDVQQFRWKPISNSYSKGDGLVALKAPDAFVGSDNHGTQLFGQVESVGDATAAELLTPYGSDVAIPTVTGVRSGTVQVEATIVKASAQGKQEFLAPQGTTIEAIPGGWSVSADGRRATRGTDTTVATAGDKIRATLRLASSPPSTTLSGGHLRVQRDATSTKQVTAFQVFSIEVAALSGMVDGVDVRARSAQISGTAAPGSWVILGGVDEVQANRDGAWSFELEGLKLGSNPVTLEQYENGVKTDETTLDVVLEVRPVSAAVSFPTDLEQDAVLSGAAQPGATVIVTDVDGTEIARTDARPGSGLWSTPIPAPNAGGDYDVRIHQQIDGEDTGEIIRTVSYGAAVQITAPVEGMAHDGGPVRMTGRGEPGAQVVVREQGGSTILGTKQVLQSGTWTLDTTNVDDRKHVLEVTQTGKGNNTTLDTVTLNPEAGEIAPVEVTNPDAATIAQGYTPNTSFTFEGTAEKGKTLQIENKYGTKLDETRVTDRGTWSWTRANMGTSTWTINFIQDKGTPAETKATVANFTPRTTATAPVAVTNPDAATIAQGYTPNTSFTFEGTAEKGKTLQVENKYGTKLDEARVTDRGTWSWTRANMGTSTWTINFIQDEGTPAETQATVLNFQPRR
jgi:hypothetical protein